MTAWFGRTRRPACWRGSAVTLAIVLAAACARDDGAVETYEFVWTRDGVSSQGALAILPGAPGPWAVVDLPGREGRTRLSANRVEASGNRLALALSEPSGSLLVDLDSGTGRLTVAEDTAEVSGFHASDAEPDSSILLLVGVDPVAPGVLSTDEAEEFPSFTPDGDTIYLTRGFREILRSTRSREGWSRLAPVAFGIAFKDRAAEVSPDGTELYFTSNRPGPGEDREVENRNHDIWRMRREGTGGWGDPERLPPTVNTDSAEYHPSLTLDGTLYFSAWSRPGGYGRSDIYRAEARDGGFEPATNLGPRVNGPGSESDVFVDPRERYIIFVSTDREDSLGGDDLYISYRTDDGWTLPRHLGPPVNSFAYEYGPTVSPDGEWLYFTSHRRGSADLYRVPLNAVLEEGRR